MDTYEILNGFPFPSKITKVWVFKSFLIKDS